MSITTRSMTSQRDAEERRRFLEEGAAAVPAAQAGQLQREHRTNTTAAAAAAPTEPEPRGHRAGAEPQSATLLADGRSRGRESPRSPILSPSDNLSLRRARRQPEPIPLEPIAVIANEPQARPSQVTFANQRRAPSIHSRASSTTEARRKEAELEASERLAELKRQELRLEAELVKKRLDARLSQIDAEGSIRDDASTQDMDRIERWIDSSQSDEAAPFRTRKADEMPPDFETPKRTMNPNKNPNYEPEKRTMNPNTNQNPNYESENRTTNPNKNLNPNFEPKNRTRQRSTSREDRRRRAESPRADAFSPRTARTQHSNEGTIAESMVQLFERMQMAARPVPRDIFELPVFYGNVSEWRSFHNIYTETAKRYNFSDYENVARLRTALRGDARACVQHVLSTATRPDLIIRILKKQYGRSEVLLDKAIDDLRRLPPLGSTAHDLNNFAIKVMNVVSTVIDLDKKHYADNPLLIREITDRLSPHLRSRWCEYAQLHEHSEDPEILQLADFLMRESEQELRFCHSRAPPRRPNGPGPSMAARDAPARTNDMKYAGYGPRAVNYAPSKGRIPEPRVSYATKEEEAGKASCLYCGGSHRTTDCRKFAAQALGARWDWAKMNGICFKCLDAKHRRDRCKAKRCGVVGCPHSHHQLLHGDSTETRGTATAAPEPPPCSTETPRTEARTRPSQEPNEPLDMDACTYTSVSSQDVLLKVLPVTITGPKGTAHVCAMLDDASTLSLLEEDIAEQIGASGPESPLNVRGIGNIAHRAYTHTVKATVRPARGGAAHDVTFRTVSGIGLRSQTLDKERLTSYEHLRDLGDECYTTGIPQMLIGADHWHLLVPTEIRMGRKDEPAAMKGPLGWAFFGTMPRVSKTNEVVMHCYAEPSDDLDEVMKKHRVIESLGVTTKGNIKPADEQALRIFNATAKRIGDRCEVGQLWAADDAKLPASYSRAYSRIRNWENQMDSDEDFVNDYAKQIQNYSGVVNKDKGRAVFDCAAKCQGHALNDYVLQGPALLQQPEEAWHENVLKKGNEADLPERKTTKITSITMATYEAKDPAAVLPELGRFSSYNRLINATANVLLFVEKLKTKNKTLQLSVKHLKQAEHMWLQNSQRHCFAEEFRALSQGKEIEKKSRIFNLAPELCNDGVLRMKTRLNNAPVQYTTPCPIILDRRDMFTRLLIAREHKRSAHVHNEAVINILRQEYWILNLRPTVKTVARSCQLCQIRRANPRAQPLGDLPAERLQPFQRPFSYCAQDYMGPLHVTIGRRREKRWVCLYTCLTSRAVHLEVVHTLSTDSAIMSLRRFAARRGWPRVMWSDNATCFKAAAVELREAFKQWLPHLRDYGTQRHMEWKFIPPGNPSAGGAWERMIRTVKTAMSYALNSRAPKEEMLLTILAEIENIVNQRPLTHVSMDPSSTESLTPSHFLLLSTTNLPMFEMSDLDDRKQWRAAQALANHFWRRWVSEYLPLLAPRQSADGGGRQVQTGDVVIIADPNGPRSVWPNGIVVATHPGPDGRVRSADVKTKHGTLRRPTCKLAVIASCNDPCNIVSGATGGQNVDDAT